LKVLEAPLLLVLPDPPAAELALDDLTTFGAAPVLFPAREARLGVEQDVLRDRFRALDRAGRPGFCGILAAPLAALLQPVPSAAGSAAVLELETGMRLDPEALMRRLVQAGYERVPALAGPGEMARRGDILDLFAPAMGEPLRLEFFDEELESVRVFDLGTQRTRHVLHHVRVPLLRELAEVARETDPLLPERLPAGFRVVRWEPALLLEAEKRQRFQGREQAGALDRLASLLKKRPVLDLAALPGEHGTLSTLSVEEYCRGVADGAALLVERARLGEQVIVCCATEAEIDRLRQILADRRLDADLLDLRIAGLERGFRIPECRLTVLHHRELVPGHGAHRPRPRTTRRGATQALPDALSLKPGDLLVHAVHGLARFRGIEPAPPASAGEDAGGAPDVLVLEFAEGALLHLPVSRVDLVERYIGAGGGTPGLDRLGSGAFERRRQRVQAAVEDLAGELLEIQARRLSSPGLAVPEGGDLQREFEAAFPFEDTPDQATGTREIHDDLGRPRAMDRLLCGDVGYGKTELAARAAFRVILAGRQVAVLVPTTVLAEQHHRSFRERFADHPVRIGVLSRIRPAAEQKQVLEAVREGELDLLIGTHRILSADVRFRNLGLVVIDEEQRFGVRAKERIKKKRAVVEVLTLTATPIPRTLHMAMAGLRDISSLSTPPAGRVEIHTEIRFDDEDAFLAEALRAEIARGGQVYYVHNRVRSLDQVVGRLRKLVPEARIVSGHGQMGPRELERAMLSFVRGEADVLCSTTIVESGLDIPNANTIFLDGAHRFGLADLHQLRGRVGRGSVRAFCYLLIPRGVPLPADARRRLKAIEELRYLGAGFQIALRDLEIRGAGSLLGPEQSGHIAAVGYEAYRRLLARAVERLRSRRKLASAPAAGIPPGPPPAADISLGVAASLPPSYIPEESTRLSVLRQFDRVTDPAALDASLAGLRDRFGPPPREVVNLARLFFLKHRLGALGLNGVQWVEDRLLCRVRDARRFEAALRPAGIDLRVITPRRAHWVLPEEVRRPPAILEYLLQQVVACPLPPEGGRSTVRAATKAPSP